jgi:hypothetical protein
MPMLKTRSLLAIALALTLLAPAGFVQASPATGHQVTHASKVKAAKKKYHKHKKHANKNKPAVKKA